MQTVVETYEVGRYDELDDAGKRGAFKYYLDNWLYDDEWEASRKQELSIKRFCDSLGFAKPNWYNAHGPGTEVFEFEDTGFFEIGYDGCSLAESDGYWYGEGMKERYNKHILEHIGEIRLCYYIIDLCERYEDEFDGGIDHLCHTLMDAQERIADIVNEALASAADIVNSDWQAEKEDLCSEEHFADLCARNDWLWRGDGTFYGHDETFWTIGA